MLPVFILAAIIIILIRIRFGKPAGAKEAERKRREFWEREERANQTRKKDISSLDYLVIPVKSLPFHFISGVPEGGSASVTLSPLPEDALPAELRQELAAAEEEILKLTGKKIKNFTGLSNTDLKLAYGAANLTVLSACDQNYTVLVRTLQKWGALLIKAGRKDEARTVFSYAVSISTDVASTYTMLAGLYKETGETEKITELMEQAEILPTLLSSSIVRSLTDIRDSSVAGEQGVD